MFKNAWNSLRGEPWYGPVWVFTVFLLVLAMALLTLGWFVHPVIGLVGSVMGIAILSGVVHILQPATRRAEQRR